MVWHMGESDVEKEWVKMETVYAFLTDQYRGILSDNTSYKNKGINSLIVRL